MTRQYTGHISGESANVKGAGTPINVHGSTTYNGQDNKEAT